MRKSLWSPDEDEKLRQYVATHGCGNWSDVAKHTGLLRCGKSCRLRWINYLRPDLKRGPFTAHEVRIVVNLHKNLGNSWSKIATHLPGRTDNDVKNFWHSYTRSRRLQRQQQQQQMNNIGPSDSYVHNNDTERPCSYNDVYNHHSNTTLDQKLRKEEKEYGNAHHEPQLPPLVFLSNTNINKQVGDCKVPIKQDNSQKFQFTKGKHEHLPSTSSNSNKILTGPHHHSHVNQLSHYPIGAQCLPSLPVEVKGCLIAPITTITKQEMIHDPFDSDAQDAIAAIYKRVQFQTTRSKGTHALSSLDHPTPSLHASNRSAASSVSGMHSQVNIAADDWSLNVSPSMQVAYVMNSHVSADGANSGVSFDQATYIDENGTPAPESLQSVIWSFFNQQEADPCAGATASDLQQAHSHRHVLLKPTSSIASSLPPSTTDIIHPPTELAADLDIEALSTSAAAALQYLQSQLAADCF